MAWRGSSSLHSATTSLADGIEDDEKQKLYQELGEAHPHLRPVTKKYTARSRPFLWSVFVMGYICPFSRRPTAGDDFPVDEAKKKPLHRQERRLKSTAGDDVVDGEAKKKPLCRQELEHAPGIQSHLHVTPINTTFQFDITSDVSTKFRSGFRSLFQWLVSAVSCYGCMSRHLTSAAGADIDDNETKPDHQKPDHQKPDQATDDPLCVIWLKGESHATDVSTFGDQVGADSAEFIATAVQRTGESATLDVVESVVLSAEYPVESGVPAEEIIIVNLGGPGEPTEALGGLSLMGYERMVFSVCPALPAVDTDLA